MKGRTVVTLLPDCAERYISTALFAHLDKRWLTGAPPEGGEQPAASFP